MTDLECKINMMKEDCAELAVKLRPCAAFIRWEPVGRTSFRLTVDSVKFNRCRGLNTVRPLSYQVGAGEKDLPQPAGTVSFVVDFGARLHERPGPITVVFDRRVPHPNVFLSGGLCTGTQTDHTSLWEVVEKAFRVIIFDTKIARLDSIACSRHLDWYKQMKASGAFPTVDPALFFTGRQIRILNGR
ncbi:hypothetical protein [Enterocloster asparagiformis]|uniref:hypothetical protein n=1 Tax=Enterocloster asparagiformis TaxID=333367 RepID=UPI00332A1496